MNLLSNKRCGIVHETSMSDVLEPVEGRKGKVMSLGQSQTSPIEDDGVQESVITTEDVDECVECVAREDGMVEQHTRLLNEKGDDVEQRRKGNNQKGDEEERNKEGQDEDKEKTSDSDEYSSVDLGGEDVVEELKRQRRSSVSLCRKVIPVMEEEENVCSICLDEFVDSDPQMETVCGCVNGVHVLAIFLMWQKYQLGPMRGVC